MKKIVSWLFEKIKTIFLTVVGSVGCLVEILGSLLMLFLICRFVCDIDAGRTYEWYYGLLHGLFVVPNWVFSFYDSRILCKAVNYGMEYNICWWAMLVMQALMLLDGVRRK